MKKQLALAVVLAAASLSANAGELNYNWLEAGYLRTDIDQIGDGDGYAINGSAALGEALHLFGGYSSQTGADDGVDVELDQVRVGLGVNYALGARADFLTRVAYERAETRVTVAGFGSGEGEVDGYSIEAGVRGLLADNFEGWVLGGFTDANRAQANGFDVALDEEQDEEFYGRVGAQLKFSPTWGLVGEGRFADDFSEVFLGARASF